MENSKTCCNVLLKLRCWLILAKYGASKLQIIKHCTQDAALDEFEIRLYLKNRFSSIPDTFTDFMRKVFDKIMEYVTNYTCSPDWSMFFGNGTGTDSFRVLSNIINDEITTVSTAITLDSHMHCIDAFISLKNEILSIINPWSETIGFYYSNLISTTLAETFVRRMRNLIIKYEYMPQSVDIRWLCDDILKSKDICTRGTSSESTPDDQNAFWFVNSTLVWNYFDDSNSMDDLYFHTQYELVQKLADRLFEDCINELRSTTENLFTFNDERYGTRIYDKDNLSNLLDLSQLDLETQNEFHTGNLAEGPHYYVPDFVELEVYKSETADGNSDNERPIKSGFDVLESVLQNYGSPEMKEKISNIKEELDKFCASDSMGNNEATEDGDGNEGSEENSKGNSTPVEDTDHKPSLLKVTILDRNQVPDNVKHQTERHHKRRGRPRKVDEYNHTSSKNNQHKYTQENVLDCSNWISDNFFEVSGNKPAIDRARLYELYTNYCLLKLCTPVDRALFGKIIRKVFPKLRSRRLIQNQVLKYHYVGLKPKFVELQQALSCSDPSTNPQEVLLSYVPPH